MSARDYFPICRIELKAVGASAFTTVLEAHQFGQANFSVSAYALPTQNDTLTISQSKKELLSFVLFEARRFGMFQAINALRMCDCRITFGELSYSQEVYEMPQCSIEAFEHVVNEEGDSQIIVTLARTLDEFGEPISATTARIGFGVGNPPQNQFDIDVVSLRDGIRLVQNQYQNPLTTRRHRRVRGYKRTFRVEFAPFQTRLGIEERLHRALMQETLYLRAWNVWSEVDATNTFREVVCTNDDIEKEDALSALASGRSTLLDFEDVIMLPKQFPELISRTLSTLVQESGLPNPNTTIIATAKSPADVLLQGVEVTLFLQRIGASEWEFWEKGLTNSNGQFVSSSQAGAQFARVRAVMRFGYAQVVLEHNLIGLA